MCVCLLSIAEARTMALLVMPPAQRGVGSRGPVKLLEGREGGGAGDQRIAYEFAACMITVEANE
jgi:hypothetical protein